MQSLLERPDAAVPTLILTAPIPATRRMRICAQHIAQASATVTMIRMVPAEQRVQAVRHPHRATGTTSRTTIRAVLAKEVRRNTRDPRQATTPVSRMALRGRELRATESRVMTPMALTSAAACPTDSAIWDFLTLT